MPHEPTPGAVSQADRDRLLIEAGLAIAAELDLDAVLDRIVELAMEITGATYGALGVLDDDGELIENFITKGVSDAVREEIGHPPVGHGILGLLIRERRPMRVPVIADDPRSVGFPPHHPPMRSFLGAPILALGRVFGNLYLTEKQGADAFTDDDEDAVVVLATQAGVAIENARLYAEAERVQHELRRLEMMEERERIAKELHDGVIQSLFAVGMGLQGTAALAEDEEIARRLESAVDEIDHAIRDLRNYIFGLRPGILADRQLGQALGALVTEFQSRTGVVSVVDIDPRAAAELASLAPDVVQLAREALSNVSRHAEATTCRVTLRRRNSEIVLEIDDDGAGFDLGVRRSGMGLKNLADRAAGLGGSVEVESIVGEGTTVRIRLPA